MSLSTITKSFNSRFGANLNLVYSTKDMSHDTWLAIRSEGLGGSEIAAVVGMSKYESKLSLWDKKVNGTTVETTEQMAAGHLFEEVIAKEFSARYGWPIQRLNYVFSHPEHSWTRCNVDYITQNPATGNWGILEIKNPSEYSRGDWESNLHLDKDGKVIPPKGIYGNIPPHYHAQGQFYAGCAGLSFVVTCGMIGGFTLCPVHRSFEKELFDELINEGEIFWNDHVLPKRRPPLQAHLKQSREALNKILGEKAPAEDAIEADDLLQELFTQHLYAKEAEKACKEQKERLASQIQEHLGEHSAATINGKKAAGWTKPRTTETVDKKTLKTKYPEIFEEIVTTKTGNPTFTITYKPLK